MPKKDVITQLKAKLKDAWLRGKEQRIEIGTLLLELRKQAEHGDWGKWLAELGMPATTAADYMVEASRHIHGIRVFGAKPDPEAKEMEQAVNQAAAQVKAESTPPDPTPPSPIPIARPIPKLVRPQLDMHNRVKGPVLICTAEQKDAYKEAKKENKDRVYEIFYNAFLEVIGERQEEVANETLAA
jgi:hypothetical protein